MVPPFGFSVGDFFGGVEFIRQLIKALDDGSGASKEYNDLIRELYFLERALLDVKRLDVNDALQPDKAVMQAAIHCQETISQLLSMVDKYQPSLRTGGSGSNWKDALRKMQWVLHRKEDVQNFRAQIQSHISSMTLQL